MAFDILGNGLRFYNMVAGKFPEDNAKADVPGGRTRRAVIKHPPTIDGQIWALIPGGQLLARTIASLEECRSVNSDLGPALVPAKPTASGRVTRRASSDPACFSHSSQGLGRLSHVRGQAGNPLSM